MARFWFQRGMAFLPFSLIIWTYISFALSYILAVSRGDVDAVFPYISDTGARRPESCIFGQMLNISACLAIATLYIRYKQVSGYVDDIRIENSPLVDKLNKASFAVAVLICLGMSLVANFQETSVAIVHFVGAMMTFGLGTVYEFMQTYVTYKMYPEINGKQIGIARLIISVLSAVFFILVTVTSGLVRIVDENNQVQLHWKPSDPGYGIHLTSTISEWLLAASFLAFFFTFLKDFQLVTIDADTHLHRPTLHHSPSDCDLAAASASTDDLLAEDRG